MAHPRQRARKWAHWAIIGSFVPAVVWYIGLDAIWDQGTFAAARSNDPAQMSQAIRESLAQTQLLNAFTLPIAGMLFLGGVGTLIALRLTRPPAPPEPREEDEYEDEEDEPHIG